MTKAFIDSILDKYSPEELGNIGAGLTIGASAGNLVNNILATEAHNDFLEDRWESSLKYRSEMAAWQLANYKDTARSANESLARNLKQANEMIFQNQVKAGHEIENMRRASMALKATTRAEAAERGVEGAALWAIERDIEANMMKSSQNIALSLSWYEKSVADRIAERVAKTETDKRAAMPTPMAGVATPQFEAGPSIIGTFAETAGAALVSYAEWSQFGTPKKGKLELPEKPGDTKSQGSSNTPAPAHTPTPAYFSAEQQMMRISRRSRFPKETR